jgi:hypothetical protein
VLCVVGGDLVFLQAECANEIGDVVGTVKGPTGSPDHHRGLHKHHIRGCGPLLLNLSLLSSFQLALEHLSQDS